MAGLIVQLSRLPLPLPLLLLLPLPLLLPFALADHAVVRGPLCLPHDTVHVMIVTATGTLTPTPRVQGSFPHVPRTPPN